MTLHPVDTWLVAALAPGDRVLLLGPGWDRVAHTLADQGVDVVVDHAGQQPWPPGVAQVDRDGVAPDAHAVVGAALADPGALGAAVAAATDRVVTRLDLADPADVGGVVGGSWPLACRSQVTFDTDWVASWDVVTDPSGDLGAQLVAALQVATTSLRALADAAVIDRDARARDAGVARRRQAAAEARARTTTALADRWAAAQQELVDILTPAPDGTETPLMARVPGLDPRRGLAGRVRSLLGRGTDPGAAEVAAPTAPRPRRTTSPGWRVATLPGTAAEWLAGWVDATVVDPATPAPETLLEHVGGHLDVLVIARVDAAERPAVTALARGAREAGATVVGVDAGGAAAWPGMADLCDLVVADAPGRPAPRSLAAPPPVDPTRVNPTVGFRYRGRGLVTVCTGTDPDLDAVRAALTELDVQTELIGPGTELALPRDLAARGRTLAPRGGVVDVPAAHTSTAEHARTLVGLAAAGVPVVAPALPGPVRELLGPVLADALATAGLGDLDDADRRELTSIRQRRAALWTHSTEARWRRLGRALDLPVPSRPPLSAVVSTNRPDHLAHCAAQLARQTYRPLEVVLALHGPHFTPAQVDAFVERVGLPVTGLAVDEHRTLGEALTLACQAASGTIVAKWDDDDHYGPDHLVDLVQALQYSGATIVGKGTEFIHLGPLDITIRRWSGRSESGSRSVAGGTLALHREDLAEAGWWRRVPRGVDQALIDDVFRAGGSLHRTHGFGFVLSRRSEGHTWAVDVDYFLGQSEGQWRGLARDMAGLDDSVLARPEDLPGLDDLPVPR